MHCSFSRYHERIYAHFVTTGDSPPTIESDATSLFYAVPFFVGMSPRESTNMLLNILKTFTVTKLEFVV
jgi:hypothetical protein